MHIAIVTGGSVNIAFASGFLSGFQPDLVIAADRGLDFCAGAGIRPDHIVGDFDSADPSCLASFRDIPTDRYPSRKDASDTEIAVRKAVGMLKERKEPDENDRIVLLGATGSRLDHVLVNLSMLDLMRREGITGVIQDPCNRITLWEGPEIDLDRKNLFGRYLSFYPWDGAVTGLSLAGVSYPVSGEILDGMSCRRFVSNEIAADRAKISWKSGKLLMIESCD